MLTVLSAKLFGELTNKTYSTLALIDYLYTATLIHQDVKEISPDKKSLFHIKELWNSKLSVLLGDYFLAKGLLLSVKNKSYNLLDIVSNSVKQITEF
ncbi:MAG: hypothetical protein HC905_20695 [Bacteroidales bacterium]|nr:hypothetical protein [Bacteroidales bacterium]